MRETRLAEKRKSKNVLKVLSSGHQNYLRLSSQLMKNVFKVIFVLTNKPAKKSED